MKKITLFYAGLIMIVGLLVPVVAANVASAVNLVDQATCKSKDCIADQKDSAAKEGCTDDEGCDFVKQYINPFIRFLTIAVGIAATIGIIFGGIQYASSGGDPQKSANGKKHIVQAIVGLIVFFFLFQAIKFLFPGGTV